MRFVVLGSPEVIFELLDKRSSITSGRQQFAVTSLIGHEFNIALHQYGHMWRRHRRAFWQAFYPKATERYLPIQRVVARQFVRMLLKEPSRIREYIRFTFAASVVKITYGIDVASLDDSHVALFNTVFESIQAFAPGRFAVSFLPALARVPGWVPGAGFQKVLALWRAAVRRAKDEFFEEAVEKMKRSDAPVSAVSDLLGRAMGAGSISPEEEEIIKNVGLTAFEGGSDTTFSSLQTFFLAMSLYPEVQEKAQQELDSVVGPGRLPHHRDRDALPYVNAVMMEALRWQNVLPLGLPHATTEDQEYRGYFIPSGTILIPNTWACLHDPEVYEDPERFNPDRFIRDGALAKDVRDPAAFVFGYGRRICPGRHFAEASLFINIATVLHVCRITPPLDDDGRPVIIEPQMTDGLLSYPQECTCNILPRSPERLRLITMAS